MEFDDTPRFWDLRVARDEWIDFSSQTVELRPSERRENLFFFSLSLISLSLSPPLSLSLCLLPLCSILSSPFLSWLSSFSPFISFLFLSYLIPLNCLFSICLLPYHFSYFLIFPHFLISFFFFIFSFLILPYPF